MGKSFGKSERTICDLFIIGRKFTFNNFEYEILESGKPTCPKGEPKTDIYVRARCLLNNSEKELKITFKQHNADFLENKTNAERAELLLGSNWKDIICKSTASIKEQFEKRPIIYKSAFHRTEKGAITLGWKFELLNKPSGELSGEMALTASQVIDVYSGTNLPLDKRNARVNGKVIENSGIATHILVDNRPCSTLQETINSLQTIEEYVAQYPKIYFACKALNYRTFNSKFDGNRPLAVYIDWHISEGKLAAKFCYDTPLLQGGNFVYSRLIKALRALGVSTTDDLQDNMIHSSIRVI
jgi:hypothetical protein